MPQPIHSLSIDNVYPGIKAYLFDAVRGLLFFDMSEVANSLNGIMKRMCAKFRISPSAVRCSGEYNPETRILVVTILFAVKYFEEDGRESVRFIACGFSIEPGQSPGESSICA
jgi:hypothetical protein